jgi:hypothetical protein
MAEIGKPIRVIEAEPLVEPVPAEAPVEVPDLEPAEGPERVSS